MRGGGRRKKTWRGEMVGKELVKNAMVCSDSMVGGGGPRVYRGGRGGVLRKGRGVEWKKRRIKPQ